ncbi:Transcriptional regulator of acetoin/glycerol metabolism [Pseudomonas flavescens]|uniref:Transcriptional regulator of acetoin/glycerol metabolism n=1 Tax=Phytopseudomonas flavescens TaxID=29435 RepID=A0A1G8Q510_9GAMM|nr:sigma 54-interacting transcriptional regulator [Pseudomonas flavescens]SDI99807.1 Transcriptional regulator of acetoin/glycerol metabolism [Pseudomonas flavescens]
MDATALRHHQQRVLARQRFIEGEPLPEGLLPDPVSRSWQRARAAGLMPGQPCLAQLEPELARLDASDEWLVACIAPEIDRLWQHLGGHTWTLYCTNTKGIIVYSRQERDSPLRQLRAGRHVHEARFGTIAPLCVLAEDTPIVLVGSQHYLCEFERFFCVSVPLHRPDGTLIGALDFTGIGERHAPQVLEQLTYAAMAAENSLYRDLDDCHVVCLQHDLRLLDTPLQGLLAVDAQGRIRAANRTAQNLLGLQGNAPSRFDSLFDNRDAPFSHRSPHLLTLNDGSRLYVQLLEAATTQAPAALPAGATELGGDATLNKRFAAACKAFVAGVPVLLQGDTGTGKEVFARALHKHWDEQAPFIAINCSAIPESLIEAELFGYVEGTFTGARKGGAPGLLEAANGGTVLLDEIGDMPLPLQTRLLRVLQERQLTRLGAVTPMPLDIRVISATHCDLRQSIAAKAFREDLYYRLSGLQVCLPTLRERSDRRLLIERLAQRYGCPPLHGDTLSVLLERDWPGNVRELEQVLRLAAAWATGEAWVMPEHLGIDASNAPQRPANTLQHTVLSIVEQALQDNAGNLSATAQKLGISRTTLYKKLNSRGKRW